jgi:riboflavin synthase
MFTGIIATVATVKGVQTRTPGAAVTIDLGSLAADARLGDSISVNGVCLTISELTGTTARFDVSSETLRTTTLAKLQTAKRVNLEPALAADGRFGGHIVLGHVDATATIKSITRKGDFVEMTFIADTHILDDMVTKGSIAVDGISLTIARLDKTSFTVALIPTTLANTTLANASVGDHVNIETDILIKSVRKQLEKILPAKSALTPEKLREHGF